MKEWLRYTTIGMEQEESINIRVDSCLVWNFISNFKQLASNIPMFADNVEIIGNEIKKLKMFKENSVFEYKIDEYIVNDSMKEIVLESIESYEPVHLLKFTVLQITEGYTYLSIKHKFLNGISIKTVNKIVDFKKKLLYLIKKHLQDK